MLDTKSGFIRCHKTVQDLCPHRYQCSDPIYFEGSLCSNLAEALLAPQAGPRQWVADYQICNGEAQVRRTLAQLNSKGWRLKGAVFDGADYWIFFERPADG